MLRLPLLPQPPAASSPERNPATPRRSPGWHWLVATFFVAALPATSAAGTVQVAAPQLGTKEEADTATPVLDLTGLWPAPAGCWVCADGSLARSRATDTPLGRGWLVQHWRIELPRRVSGEALVSGEYCLALTSDSEKHFGQWFDLYTGQPVGDELKAEIPLTPCLAGNRAVLRLDQNRLAGIEIGPEGWRVVCTWSIPSVGEPLFDGAQVYVRDSHGLVCLAWGQAKPLARLDLELMGRIAWLPDSIMVLARSPESGNFHWVKAPLDLSTPDYGPAALPIDAVDRGNLAARLYPGALKHYCESANIYWNGSHFAWLPAGPKNGLFKNQLERDAFSSYLHSAPAQCAQGALGWLRHQEWTRDNLMFSAAKDQWVVNGPTMEFERRGQRSVAVASDGVWIDRRAISLDGQSMVQLIPGADPFWVLPTTYGPLVCRDDHTLELWGRVRRTANAQRPPLTEWPAELLSPAVLEDPKAIVLGDPAGPVLSGPFVLSAGRLNQREPEPARPKGRNKPSVGLQPSELSLWITGDGQLLHVTRWSAFKRGLYERLRLSAMQALANSSLPAQQSSEPVVIARALSLAREFGLTSESEKLAAAADRVERQKRKARADRVEVATVALDGFEAERSALVERAFTDLLGEQLDELGWEALRQALDDPKTREFARQRVDQGLPRGLDASLGSPHLRLELARLNARRGIVVVGVEGGLQPAPNSVLSEEMIRARWGSGRIGLLSPDLFVFGDQSLFENLMLAMLRGQLLVDKLSGFLGAPLQPIDARLYEDAAADSLRRPLATWVLGAEGDAQVFETRRQLYQPEFYNSRRGLYDDRNAVTLVHWLPGSATLTGYDADFIQALTRHWLDLRCPLYADTQQARGGLGYWARVGLPIMAAELRLDLFGDLAVVDQGRSRTAIFLAALDRELWIPWPQLIVETEQSIQAASQVPVTNIELPWFLDRLSIVTASSAHQAQSAQLCAALLFSSEDRHRAAYARVLGAYHRGDTAAASLLSEGGLDAAELERLMRAQLGE